MKNIVVLSSVYLDIPSANGLCARNLVTELKKLGYRVSIVCYESEDINSKHHNDEIHTIKKKIKPYSITKCSLVYKIEKAFNLVFKTNSVIMDLEIANNYYRKLVEINSKMKIDSIIAMFFPLEAVQALYRFKEKNNHIDSIIYELDSIGDGVAQSSTNCILTKIYDKWLVSVYTIVDSIIVMKGHANYWNIQFGKRFGNKMHVSDIPVLVENQIAQTTKSESMSMLYSGILDRNYRSPSYLISVLQEMNQKIDFDFYFYSKGNCEEEIARATEKVASIHQMGYVSPEELTNKIECVNILVSIGNTVSNSVPSKLIFYFTRGKPIIHFSFNKNDVCIDYLDRYPYALIIDQLTPISKACDLIMNFIEASKGKPINISDIQKIFVMNTPSYSAKLIDMIIS
jgi:hypothetical protein